MKYIEMSSSPSTGMLLGTSPFDMSAYVTSPSGRLENCEIM